MNDTSHESSTTWRARWMEIVVGQRHGLVLDQRVERRCRHQLVVPAHISEANIVHDADDMTTTMIHSSIQAPGRVRTRSIRLRVSASVCVRHAHEHHVGRLDGRFGRCDRGHRRDDGSQHHHGHRHHHRVTTRASESLHAPSQSDDDQRVEVEVEAEYLSERGRSLG